MEKEIVVSATTALIVSAVANRILALHTFKVIDGYIRGLLEDTKKIIIDVCADIKSRLENKQE